MGQPSSERLREPPRARFSGDQKKVDLRQEFERLPEESRPQHGHSQKVVYRHGRTTTAIFAFDAGAAMREHTVEGEAILHVLEGRIAVTAADTDYELGPGQLLLLDPGVPHDLVALQQARLLLHVVLERDTIEPPTPDETRFTRS